MLSPSHRKLAARPLSWYERLPVFFFPGCASFLTYTYIESQANRFQWSQRFQLIGESRRPQKKKENDGGSNRRPLAPWVVNNPTRPRRPHFTKLLHLVISVRSKRVCSGIFGNLLTFTDNNLAFTTFFLLPKIIELGQLMIFLKNVKKHLELEKKKNLKSNNLYIMAVQLILVGMLRIDREIATRLMRWLFHSSSPLKGSYSQAGKWIRRLAVLNEIIIRSSICKLLLNYKLVFTQLVIFKT